MRSFSLERERKPNSLHTQKVAAFDETPRKTFERAGDSLGDVDGRFALPAQPNFCMSSGTNARLRARTRV
jgi:hypothetical protein